MPVWILHWYDYDIDDIRGVFSSEELMLEHFRKQSGEMFIENHPYYGFTTHTLDDPGADS